MLAAFGLSVSVAALETLATPPGDDAASRTVTSDEYARYERHQYSKLGNSTNTGAPMKFVRYVDSVVYRSVLATLREFEHLVQSPALCVGARLGGEVRAFQSMPNVQLAIGVDFNPGERNAAVVWGDAHTLSHFKNDTFGSLYTNVIDHFLYVDQFIASAFRVLRPGGTLFLEMHHQAKNTDQWAVQDLITDRPKIERMFEALFERVHYKAGKNQWKVLQVIPARCEPPAFCPALSWQHHGV
jgi:SAM-dependent methyltransferase